MPRRPLSEISGNTGRGKDLTAFQLGQIAGLVKVGVGGRKTGRILELSPQTVCNARKRLTKLSTTAPRKRSGKLTSYFIQDERAVIRGVRYNSKLSVKEIEVKSGIKRCLNTITENLEEKQSSSLDLEAAHLRTLICFFLFAEISAFATSDQ